MIVKGNWKGQYKYDNKRILESKGVEATKFEIDITAIDGDHFIGNVEDDVATGGTEGIGEITGRVNGNQIEFVKQMPVMTVLVSRTGERKTFSKKHRPIYYTGTFSDDGKKIIGVWKFKFGFSLVGLLLIIGKGNSGTWTMTLAE